MLLSGISNLARYLEIRIQLAASPNNKRQEVGEKRVQKQTGSRACTGVFPRPVAEQAFDQGTPPWLAPVIRRVRVPGAGRVRRFTAGSRIDCRQANRLRRRQPQIATTPVAASIRWPLGFLSLTTVTYDGEWRYIPSA